MSTSALSASDSAPSSDVAARVRAILAEHGRLPVEIETLADGDDLYDAGMTSRASVGVMLALEEDFEVEFPDELLRRDVFQSIEAIARAIDTLLAEA
jgi:acyl carrier protein